MRRFSKSCASEVVTVRVDLDWAFTASETMRADLTALYDCDPDSYDQLLVSYFKCCVGGARVIEALEERLTGLYGCSWGVPSSGSNSSFQSLRITGASLRRNEVAIELANGGLDRLRAACALVSRIPTVLSGLRGEGADEGKGSSPGPLEGNSVGPEWLDAHDAVLALMEDIRTHLKVQREEGGGNASGDMEGAVIEMARSHIVRGALPSSNAERVGGVDVVAAVALRMAIIDVIATGGPRHEVPCRLVVTQAR